MSGILRRIKKTIAKVFMKRSFIKNVLMMASGNLIAQFIALAVSPILSRLFSPGEFGILSIYTSMLIMISAFSTLSFDRAIPLIDSDSDAINVLVTSILVAVIISGFVFLITLWARDFVVSVFNAEELRSYLWMLAIGVLIVGIYTALSYWAVRKEAYKEIMMTRVNQGIAKSGFQVFSGIVGLGALGLLFGEMAGQGIGIGTLLRVVRKDYRREKGTVSLKRMKAMILRYRKFPLFSSWSILLATVDLQVPILALSVIYSTEVAGIFGFAHRIVSIPLNFLGISVSKVFLREGVKLSKSSPEELRKLSKATAKRLAFIGVFVASVFFFLGPALFSFVFGAPWRESGIYAQVISLLFIVRFSVFPIVQLFTILERQGLQLLLDLLKLLLVLGAFFLSSVFSCTPIQAVLLYTISTTICYVVLYIVAMKVLERRIQEHGRKNQE